MGELQAIGDLVAGVHNDLRSRRHASLRTSGTTSVSASMQLPGQRENENPVLAQHRRPVERPTERPAENYSCVICHDTGWLRKLVGPEVWRTELVRCMCQRESDERRRAEKAWAISDLDRLHAGCTFDGYDGTHDGAASDAAQEWARGECVWLMLWGIPGNGKTHLLAAAFNALLAAGKVPCYTVVPLLLDHIRAGYDSGDYGERFQVVMQAPILLLDDLGAQKRSDWSDEALFKLLDYRYRYELPTAVGSNLPPDELEERIASRLQDGALSVVVRMRGPDHRKSRKSRTRDRVAG